MTLEHRQVVPHFAERLRDLYATWMSNLDLIRQQLGSQVADDMEYEATVIGPTVQKDEAVLLVAISLPRQA